MLPTTAIQEKRATMRYSKSNWPSARDPCPSRPELRIHCPSPQKHWQVLRAGQIESAICTLAGRRAWVNFPVFTLPALPLVAKPFVSRTNNAGGRSPQKNQVIKQHIELHTKLQQIFVRQDDFSSQMVKFFTAVPERIRMAGTLARERRVRRLYGTNGGDRVHPFYVILVTVLLTFVGSAP
jgi:hypothetical protein